jgi:signal transduction histidine kinase
MRQPDAEAAMAPSQALWERLTRRVCSAAGPAELLACLLTPFADAPGLRALLAREDAAGALHLDSLHPTDCTLSLPDDLPQIPAGECWATGTLATDGTQASVAALVRRGPDGRRAALVLGAEIPAELLGQRLRDWGPALATALCLPHHEAGDAPVLGVDPLEMTRHVSAALAHDVRNIMSGIIGALELQRSTGEGAGEEVFDAIRRRAVEGVAMVEAMMGRLRAGHRPATEEVDLLAAARDFAGAVEPLAQVMAQHGVGLTVSGEPARARVERPELARALLALVFNSWRACRGGGTVKVLVDVRRGRAVLEVQDDGAGMTPEVHRRAKEPFYTTEPQIHWGLGLTIAEEVAKQAQGSLVIRPREDRGTTVTVSLPLS